MKILYNLIYIMSSRKEGLARNLAKEGLSRVTLGMSGVLSNTQSDIINLKKDEIFLSYFKSLCNKINEIIDVTNIPIEKTECLLYDIEKLKRDIQSNTKFIDSPFDSALGKIRNKMDGPSPRELLGLDTTESESESGTDQENPNLFSIDDIDKEEETELFRNQSIGTQNRDFLDEDANFTVPPETLSRNYSPGMNSPDDFSKMGAKKYKKKTKRKSKKTKRKYKKAKRKSKKKLKKTKRR